MIFEIRVASQNENDSKGNDLLAEIKRTLKLNSIKKIRSAKVYRLEGVSISDAKIIASKVLFEPLEQQMKFDTQIFKDANKKIEVAYKPGVMNPEAASIIKSSNDLGIKLKAADSSWEYAFYGSLKNSELEEIINKLLVNKTVEQLVTKTPKTLLISGKPGKINVIAIRKMSENQLLELSKDRLFLNLEEMKIIQNYFISLKRDPYDCEIEVIAQTWSEHCVHKTFSASLEIDGVAKEPLFKRIKKTAGNNKKLIVSAFDDNSGVIDFYEGFGISGKVETHNSPSAIEPYGGAMTGSGGVFRDILGTGQGAKIIASTDIFCFAPPDLPEGDIPPGCLPPEYILRKVVAGVRDYGNRIGIPTNNGSIHFHPDFRAKPTVAVGSYGLIPKKVAQKGSPKKGDLILTVGGRTGRDGIHGATFSSGEMTDKTITTSGSAVQIGNAIEEKRTIDAILKLRDEGLIRAITDCGAGGYSSAVGEIAKEIGATVYLEKVPLKYPGLSPWEIFVSESQERMVLAVGPRKIKKVEKICKLYNVEVTVIGRFDGTKKLTVTFNKKEACNLDMKFLHEGLPQRKMKGTTGKRENTESSVKFKLPDLEKIWQKVMAHPNVCSKEAIVRLYDHNVQGTNALHPFGGVNYDGPNDGAVIKPILNKSYGVVITHGLNPILVRLDPYHGSVWAIIEAVSNFVSVGGNISEAALVDNFIWPFPDEESLAELDKSVDACVEISNLLKMPFISGKDSLSSTYRYPEGKVLKIPPVLLISVFGRIPDVKKTVSSDFKASGSTIVLVGEMDTNSLGGSAYLDVIKGKSSRVPQINLKKIKNVFSAIHRGIFQGKIISCHDISEGGLASAIAEMSFGGDCGARIDLAKISSGRLDHLLFNETAGTFLVEVKDPKMAKEIFKDVPFKIIGTTLSDRKIELQNTGKTFKTISVDILKSWWQKPMEEIFN